MTIAAELRLDPVLVMEETDLDRRAARLGAALLAQRRRKKEQDAKAAQQSRH